jgi:hypothetical protein
LAAIRKKRNTVAHIIDGISYRSAKDVERHKLLRANPSVKSFHLPDKKESSVYSRYGAHKCEINGIIFDSVLEGMYYVHLLDLLRKKLLKKVDRQVTYTLLDGFTHKATGKKVRPITYLADFVLTDFDGNQLVIDVKGKKTPEFKLKEKMFLAKYPDVEFMCVQYDDKAGEWRNLEDIEKDRRARKRERAKKAS